MYGSIDEVRCCGLAEIVAERRVHKPGGVINLISVPHGHIEHEHGVLPDSAFGVTGGVLLNAPKSLYLGEPVIQSVLFAEDLKEHGGLAGLQQRLAKLRLHALLRKRCKVHTGAELNRFRGDREAEASSELRPAQDAERILAEGGIGDMAEDFIIQVFPAAGIIEDFAGKDIFHEGINREVAAGGRLLRTYKRVGDNIEVAVAAACGRFLPGQGDIHIAALEGIYAEALAYSYSGAERIQNSLQLIRGDAVDFNINILIVYSEKTVTDIAAHIVGGASGFIYRCCDFLRGDKIFIVI